MSEQINDEIDYKAEYESMKADLEKANAESARRKRDNATLKSEIETLKSLTPEKLKTQVETLKGELRSIKHKEGFKALYDDKELGLNPKVGVDSLFKILDYRAESDEFDAAAVKEQLAALKDSESYLFVEKSEGEAVTSQSPTIQAPSWSGRGVSQPETNSRIKPTEADFRDPKRMAQIYGK